MISFQPFFDLCKKRNISQRSVVANGTIGLQQLHNMKHGGAITTRTIDALCAALDCLPSDIFEYIPAPSAEALPPAPGEETPARLPSRTATDGAAQDTNT